MPDGPQTHFCPEAVYRSAPRAQPGSTSIAPALCAPSASSRRAGGAGGGAQALEREDLARAPEDVRDRDESGAAADERLDRCSGIARSEHRCAPDHHALAARELVERRVETRVLRVGRDDLVALVPAEGAEREIDRARRRVRQRDALG